MSITAGFDTEPVTAETRAPLNYLAPMREKPVNYMYKAPPGTPQTSRIFDPHVVTIHNGRIVPGGFDLDREGFALIRRDTAVVDFYDRDEVKAVYYPEIERLLMDETGAIKVVVFDATMRNGSASERSGRGLREPVQAVHNDYTVNSGPQRVRDLLPPDEAEARLKKRFAEINVWRPIKGPVEEWPLALCDARSIAFDDFVATEQRYQNRTGEIYSITYNPGHRWYYFPKMDRDEAVLIKGFDSLTDGRARFTAHTSFIDPASPSDAAPRESIEIRALLVFP
jgi:hypothetical protein